MTTEEDFQKQLDANPDDFQTRLVFADFLQEGGDERAEGYRALGFYRRVASIIVRDTMKSDTKRSRRLKGARWCFWNGVTVISPGVPSYGQLHDELHGDWWQMALCSDRLHDRKQWISRRAAEDAAARGFALLSAERRAELHAVAEVVAQ